MAANVNESRPVSVSLKSSVNSGSVPCRDSAALANRCCINSRMDMTAKSFWLAGFYIGPPHASAQTCNNLFTNDCQLSLCDPEGAASRINCKERLARRDGGGVKPNSCRHDVARDRRRKRRSTTGIHSGLTRAKPPISAAQNAVPPKIRDVIWDDAVAPSLRNEPQKPQCACEDRR